MVVVCVGATGVSSGMANCDRDSVRAAACAREDVLSDDVEERESSRPRVCGVTALCAPERDSEMAATRVTDEDTAPDGLDTERVLASMSSGHTRVLPT